MEGQATLAERLGKTAHISVLRHKVRRLALEYPSSTATCLEQWLIDVANQRGARSVRRPAPPSNFTSPGDAVLSGAELIVALCQLQCLDQPHILRVAAQLISRGAFDATQLRRIAVMERVEPILQGLSRLALHVDPASQYWRTVGGMFAPTGPLREPLLHWSRLAQPVMQNGHCNAASWELLA